MITLTLTARSADARDIAGAIMDLAITWAVSEDAGPGITEMRDQPLTAHDGTPIGQVTVTR